METLSSLDWRKEILAGHLLLVFSTLNLSLFWDLFGFYWELGVWGLMGLGLGLDNMCGPNIMKDDEDSWAGRTL